MNEAEKKPNGYPLRDGYRIRTIQKRAKEQGRAPKAYALDLFHELEQMGKGFIERRGKQILLCLGEKSIGTEVELIVPIVQPQAEQTPPLAHALAQPSTPMPFIEKDGRRKTQWL